MADIATYLTDTELALISSSIITDYCIIRSWAHTDDGYIRVRATLANGDFLEATEYVVLQAGQLMTVDYRYQWMSNDKTTLHRRWDSTPDHPELSSFPHHVHVGSEKVVLPSQPLSLTELLRLLDLELYSETDEDRLRE